MRFGFDLEQDSRRRTYRNRFCSLVIKNIESYSIEEVGWCPEVWQFTLGLCITKNTVESLTHFTYFMCGRDHCSMDFFGYFDVQIQINDVFGSHTTCLIMRSLIFEGQTVDLLGESENIFDGIVIRFDMSNVKRVLYGIPFDHWLNIRSPNSIGTFLIIISTTILNDGWTVSVVCDSWLSISFEPVID